MIRRAGWYHGSVQNLYLVGFMGAGKTSVGRAYVDRYGGRFLDLDEAIEGRFSLSIREIFESRGEEVFRAAETAELERTTVQTDLVVATGGGLFSSVANRDLIVRSGGVAVFLDLPWEVIRQRLGATDPDRPKWIDEQHARELFFERRPRYLTAGAHLRLAGEETPQRVAEMIDICLTEVSCAS